MKNQQKCPNCGYEAMDISKYFSKEEKNKEGL